MNSPTKPLVAGSPDTAACQTGSAHLEMMQEAADLAEKGQMDRALDLFLGARIGEDWRDRFSKPRLGAIRRSAGNLAPLLVGTISPISPDALDSLDLPVVLLVRDDAEVLERVTVETLASLLPRTRVTTLPPQSHDQLASGSGWTEAIAAVLLGR